MDINCDIIHGELSSDGQSIGLGITKSSSIRTLVFRGWPIEMPLVGWDFFHFP
jgi:hypothetical protein